MKISKDTVTLLSNFANINPNIYIEAGNEIKTKVQHSSALIATATVPETWPVAFSVYSLQGLLTTLSLFEDPDLEITTENIKFQGADSSATYANSEKSLLDAYTDYSKSIEIPAAVLEFNFSDSDFKRIQKSAKLFNSEDINISAVAPNTVRISAASASVAETNSNNFMIDIPATGAFTEGVSVDIKLELLKLIPTDYEASISIKENSGQHNLGILKLNSNLNDIALEYIVAGKSL